MRNPRRLHRAGVALLGAVTAVLLTSAPAHAADVTGAVTVGGAATTVTTVTANQNASLTMAGTAAARVALEFTGFTYRSCVLVTVKAPDASAVRSSAGVCGASFQEPLTLPTTGTYTIVLDPMGTATGSVTVTARSVPADATGSMTVDGAAVPIATTAPAQNSKLTFSGTSGQRVALVFSDLTYIKCVRASITKPDATTLRAASAVCAPVFFEPVTLTSTGTHTVWLDPSDSATGSITVRAVTVPGNVSGTLTPGAAATTVTMAVPGQDAALTFAGTAGQRISVQFSGSTMSGSCTDVTVKDPIGGQLIRTTGLCTPARFFEPVTLSTTGTYTVAIEPRGSSTGSLQVRLFTVAADAATALTAGGSAAAVTTTAPGQNAKFTFTGTSGQRVSAQLTAVSFNGGCVAAKLLAPAGTTLVSLGTVCGSDAFAEPITLTATGAYTLTLDPRETDTGSVTGQVFLVPADPTATVTVGGAGATVTTTMPGQNATLSFAGTAAAKPTLWFTASTLGAAQVTVRKPGGVVLAIKSVTASGSMKLTLPTTGTYTVTIDPRGATIGSITAAITS